MGSIELEITKLDIKEYLSRHQEDESIKYREAMFVKYMKEQGLFTKEAYEMFSDQYPEVVDNSSTKQIGEFSSYLKLQNLDISGICHILIPTLREYSPRSWTAFKVEDILEQVAVEFGMTVNDSYAIVSDVIDDYDTAFRQRSVTRIINDEFVDISLNRAWCGYELESYANIYGKENVQKIRQCVKNRM